MGINGARWGSVKIIGFVAKQGSLWVIGWPLCFSVKFWQLRGGALELSRAQWWPWVSVGIGVQCIYSPCFFNMMKTKKKVEMEMSIQSFMKRLCKKTTLMYLLMMLLNK